MVCLALGFLDKKLEREYSLLKEQSRFETIQATLLFWLIFLISFSITLFNEGDIAVGAVFIATIFIITVMLIFKKPLQNCNQYLIIGITFMLNLSTLVYSAIEIGHGSTSLQLLRGWSFASAQIIVVNQFSKFCYKFGFILISFTLRYSLLGSHDTSVFVPDIVIRNVLTDIFVIYILFNLEKRERIIFKSFYEYREELTKFKEMLDNYLPQSVTILNKTLEKTLFSNKAFLNLFGGISAADVNPVGSSNHLQNKLISENIGQDLAGLKLKIERSTSLKSFDCHSAFWQKETDLNLFIKKLVENKFFGRDVVSLNACSTQNGRTKSFEIIIKQITWDREEAIAVILNDVTYQKNILALKIADKNKDLVLATVSHELRTPLNGIIGILQIIEPKINHPEVHDYLSLCKDNAILLLSLVNSLLDLQQINQRRLKVNISKVEVNRLFRDTLRLFYFQAFQKKIYLDLKLSEDVPNVIYTDENRVKQILINLIGNALKFTFEGGITVEVTNDKADEKCLIIAVTDTGIGIKENDKNKLFKMYGKLEDSEAINKNGVGLGLTISDTLAKSLNGQTRGIEMESQAGVGTKFWFKLIKNGEEEKEDEEDTLFEVEEESSLGEDETKCVIPKELESSQKDFQEKKLIRNMSSIQNKISNYTLDKRIGFRNIKNSLKDTFSLENVHFSLTKQLASLDNLGSLPLPSLHSRLTPESEKKSYAQLNTSKGMLLIVDDNAFNLMIARNFAEEIGYSVETAMNGKEAIEKVKETINKNGTFDFILMDCQMPIMDGFEATNILMKLMNNNELPRIPIIALTANNSEEDVKRCFESGMVQHLTKPLILGDLEKTLLKLRKNSS